MKKIINTILCILFAIGAFAMIIPLFEGYGKFWHGAMCVIFACSSIAFSSRRIEDNRYRKIS